jgi:serine/threonine-protein kinase
MQDEGNHPGSANDGLPPPAWSRLEAAIKHFEDAWRRGTRPSLDDYLAPAARERRTLLVELVHADLECRLKVGEPARAEDYLRRYPELSADPAAEVELILAEYRLRRRREIGLTGGEYLRRFPRRRRELLPHLDGVDEDTVAAAGPATHDAAELRPDHTAGAPSLPGPVSQPAPWPTLPGYEIQALLGRGGMAVVYLARQTSLKRLVALKMIHTGAHAEPAHLARFRREAEIVAQFQHPNIVQIYEVGEDVGSPYLCLEYAAGGTLAQRLAGSPQPPRQAARLVEVIARAVHHAHEHGIIHRDLKPSNILLTAPDPVPARAGPAEGVVLASWGTPKVSDFGLARRLDEAGGHTQEGDILGTPSYMAPEQAQGKKDLTCAVDVYALGAILYEMLTGHPVFRGASFVETLRQVVHDEPLAPERLQPGLPRDLQTICLKCLHKDPAQRYPSAGALAGDLQSFLSGEPIWARPERRWEKAARWVRRRPLLAVLGGVTVAALLGLGAGVWLHSPLTMVAVAVLGLVGGGGWYSARLRSAVREVARQRVAAERHVERMHLLLEMTHQLVAAPDREVLLRRIGEATARLAQAERATIFLVDLDRGELWSKVAMGEGVGEIRVPLGVGIAGIVAASGEWVIIDDAYADARFNPEVDRQTGYKTRNLLTLPMKGRGGQTVGVLQVLNKRQGPFQPDDIEILAALAASAALAVEEGAQHGRRET